MEERRWRREGTREGRREDGGEKGRRESEGRKGIERKCEGGLKGESV